MSQPHDPSPVSPLPISPAEDHSTLEAVTLHEDSSFLRVNRQPKPSITTFDPTSVPELAVETEKIYDPRSATDTLKECNVSTPSGGQTLAESDTSSGSYNEAVDKSRPQRRICGLPIKALAILLGLFLLVVGVAVGVSVGVFLHRVNGHSTPAAAPSSNANIMNPHTNMTNGNSSSTIPTNATVPTNSSESMKIKSDSKLASVSWNNTDGFAEYRIYYQVEDGTIRESAWNASASEWRVTDTTLRKVKDGSPIAALVSAPGTITLYAIADNGTLINWFCLNGQPFADGKLFGFTIMPANTSQLTAMFDSYEGCTACPKNNLLAYERNDGQLELGNLTGSGWKWTTLDSHPAPGTDLSLTLHWSKTGPGDLRLYYQVADGHLVSQDFNAPHVGFTNYTWTSQEGVPVADLGQSSPLTTFTWGTTGQGNALFGDIVSSNSSGLTVNQWEGISNFMMGTQKPPALNSVNAVSLAANDDAHIYALQAGNILEYRMGTDGSSWSLVGNVTPP